ncbi:hypothetical protein CI105_00270 [Candidatus Izimaplasma bacterium ZiA1]|uniref:YlxM family DNA-binding protein n=1 Tax=Candidatus Izimoplasma sp. ZiA1 TaxID=2024899 RepID=UPI000BAA3A4C|nr:hypothetical protein CI105_00270 [Candidatus Izimaplasma bacterium ZiA1]
MDTLQKSLEIIALFDIYQNLLTQKQIDYITDYYYNDYSLAEISENYNVSRNAVLDLINRTTKKLYEFESKLNLHQKETHIKKVSNEIINLTKDKKIISLIRSLEKVE